eukprot:4931166-Heterocapsa_arctica.AAC.1
MDEDSDDSATDYYAITDGWKNKNAIAKSAGEKIPPLSLTTMNSGSDPVGTVMPSATSSHRKESDDEDDGMAEPANDQTPMNDDDFMTAFSDTAWT